MNDQRMKTIWISRSIMMTLINSFRGLWVFDRWSGIFSDAMMIQDVAFYRR
jgi:hypothetical protein